MNTRPIIDLPKTALERWLDVTSWLFVTLAFAIALSNYSALPQTIPTHFNASGVADDYGSKNTIFLLPVLTFLVVGLTSILSRFPHRFNYLTTITPENAATEYLKMRKFLRFINVFISLLMLWLTWSVVQAALTQSSTLGKSVIFLLIGPVVGVPFFIWYLSRKPDVKR